MTADVADHGTFDERGIRPIQAILPAPRTNAVARLAERLVSEYDHTPEAAQAIAEAVEDPRAAREQLGRLSRVPVRGGTLYTLDVRVNALRMVIDPVNPRTVGSIDYPASEDSAGRAKFWGPRDLTVDDDTPGELVFAAGTTEALRDALDDAKSVLRDQNPLARSIGLNGVFFPLTVMPWRIVFNDGEELTTLVARDGSSRLNSAQENLGIAPSDPIFGAVADVRRSRGIVTELAASVAQPQEQFSTSDAAKAHSLMVPARIIVAYQADPGADADLLDVVDEFVALLHLDPPTPWSPPAEAHKRADLVVDQLLRENAIRPQAAEYFAGMLDKESAAASRLPSSPDERAAIVAWFFMQGASDETKTAFARGIRELTGRGKARKEYKTPIIASLVLRGARWTRTTLRKSAESTLPRTYMMSALWDRPWRPTSRTPDQLLERALEDLGETQEPSRAILELAVRGSYYLVVNGALGREGFGQSGDEDKDNRTPAAVLAEMCRSDYGLRVLHRAIIDGHAGRSPQRIAPDGNAQVDGTGLTADIDNVWLRSTFRAAGKPSQPGPQPPTASPTEQLMTALRQIRQDVSDLAASVAALRSIRAENGYPIVDELGVAMEFVQTIDEEFRFGVTNVLYPYGGIHASRNPANAALDDDEADAGERP